ncbi:HNH endonuclease [Streptomyces sp. NPDC056352]|uniref:HNH endonuclease n=1 Tax=Streptomyces sp. NPDC056352 TaxID=3345791 RepID=UPI0035DF3C87
MSAGNCYTRERLAEAAQKCTTIDEVIAFLGTAPYKHLGRYLLMRFAHFGIDVSHFRRRAPRPTASELSEAVAASISIADTLRRLGRPDSTSQRNHLRRWLAEDGIATPHFLGQAHQRGRPGTTPVKHPDDILVKHDGKRRTSTVLLRRALREIGLPERCEECGTGPLWHGNPMTLEIDHINGDWSDDRVENLRLLCPNCHAITDTWCRGGSRRSTC